MRLILPRLQPGAQCCRAAVAAGPGRAESEAFVSVCRRPDGGVLHQAAEVLVVHDGRNGTNGMLFGFRHSIRCS